MAAESIILNVEFNAADIKAASDLIVEARKNLTDLTAANKELAAQGQQTSKAYQDNAKAIKASNDQLTQNSRVVQANTQAVKANADSIEGLKAANKELLKERNLTSTATEDGRAKIAKLNAEYDKNSKIIAANSTQVEKQRFNIGNYASALDKVGPGLSNIASGLTAATKGQEGLTGASKAFILTGVGAIIAGLVLAFQALKTFVTGSTEGMDKFEDVMSSVSTVVDVVVDRVVALVGGIGKLLSGDFTGGLEQIEGSFKGIGDEIEREISLTLELNEAIRSLEDAEINYDIAASKNANTIKELLLQAKNRTLSEKERIALLKQADEIEAKQNEQLVANKKEALRIQNEEANKRVELARIAGESEEAFAQRLLDTGKLLDDQRDSVKNAIIAYNGALGESINIREKVQNQIDALEEKAAADAEKRNEKIKKDADDKAKKELDDIKKKQDAEKKAADDAEKARQDRIKQLADQNAHDEQVAKDAYDEALKLFHDQSQAMINEKKQQLLDGVISQEEYNKELEDLQIAMLETQQAINEEFAEKDLNLEAQTLDYKKKLSDQELKIHQEKERAKVDAVQSALGTIASAFNKQSLAYKILASVQTTIDTIRGAVNIFFGMTEAIPGPVGIILGAAAAAAAAANGYAAVAKINSTAVPKMADGGRIEIEGRSHAQGGELVTIGGRAVAEVEGGEDMVIMKRGSRGMLKNLANINRLSGGVDFYQDRAPKRHLADGGFVARSAANQVSSLQNQTLAEDIKKLKLFVGVTDIINGIKMAQVTDNRSELR